MENTPLIGRKEEKNTLENALLSPRAEMVAVIGRRRVGKTFLVKSVYRDKIDFEITGIQHATRKEQLRNFMIQLNKFSGNTFALNEPKDWLEAFYILTQFLERKEKQEKIIVFLDELPWLATHRSGFLKGLSYFWNSWAVEKNIVLVICGSAASWMIRKVIHHKGGLHNRVTKRIYLKPFSLAETEHFFEERHIQFDRYQILHLYMALGGVPHYLHEVEGGKSAVQNINQICFAENGLLKDEFPKLFASLFEDADKHMKIIRSLVKKRKGMTRSEIVKDAGLSEGGGVSNILEELLHSGFIAIYQPFGKKKKDSLYRLVDEYSLFYLQFIEENRNEGPTVWKELSQTQAYKSWTGYAFESICLKHINQIKQALGISGVYSTVSSFYKKRSEVEEGVQIDLLIDRKDHVINICEMKFYSADLSITKSMATELRNKVAVFKETTRTRKQTFLTLITTFGIRQNPHSQSVVDSVLTMDDLFDNGQR